jgi:hypothetical protein
MPGFMLGIHVFIHGWRRKTWMAGTSPAMTSASEPLLAWQAGKDYEPPNQL